MTRELPAARLMRAGLAGLALAALAVLPARAQTLAGPDLVQALRQGGYVIVMRHASSPPTPPAPAEADPANIKGERQLDDKGRAAAKAMGEAIRRLRLPIGEAWSSPTYRALQTLKIAGLHGVRSVPELGDNGQSMQATSGAQAAWLKVKAAQAPRPRTDTVVATHQPNIAAAFGQAAAGLSDGEALVFHPDGRGSSDLVARIRMEDWPALAAAGR